MTLQIGRFTPYEQLAASTLAGPAAPTAPTPRPQDVPFQAVAGVDRDQTDTILGDVPPAPTAEAREMVDKAAERVQELYAKGRELHFTHDDASNRVVIEVRDLEGNVIKTIPPAKALDIMSGAEL